MSIARSPRPSSANQWFSVASPETWIAFAAVLVGIVAWAYYLRSDLILSHYDAKAHLVVARRVLDNLTPGWQQIGAVWLPLPHLLLLAPVQNDLLYRTGFAGSAISLACLAVTAYAIAALVRRITGSTLGSVVAVALVALNPSLLYLFTTPMTEPLLFAVTALLALWLLEWLDSADPRLPQRVGWLLVAAMWTRYEAWAVVGGAGVLAAGILAWRDGLGPALIRRAFAFLAWPAAAAALFLANSRITVGQWFVSDGFFVPDATYAGQVGQNLEAILEGTYSLGGRAIVAAAALGVCVTIWKGISESARLTTWLPLALFATALLPLAAFFEGHPFRIRYMTPLVVASALWSAVLIGWLPRRVRVLAASALLLVATIEAPPFASSAPMVVEAQLDRSAGRARQAVSQCLAGGYRGEKVLASMGSLAHYMQELSRYGFALRDFVHEGNGIIWEVALESGPARHAGWMLVEEVAEGGDVLAQRIRRDPSFINGMARACSGGGVTLYRRIDVRRTFSDAVASRPVGSL